MKIARTLDAEIDRLYQLPLGEFTAARNALAKDAGPSAAEVRALEKPTVVGWAINQLYWQRRPAYDALARAAARLRSAHGAVVRGQSADLREASQEHEAQIEETTRAATALLMELGQPITDATKQAIVTTLRALPVDGRPGRLTRALQPAGFDALAHLRAAAGPARAEPATSRSPTAGAGSAVPAARKTAAKPVDTKALTRARDQAASAARAARAAEQAARQAEFERARAAREFESATNALTTARAALERAQQAVEDGEIAVTKATRARNAAEHAARQAEAAVETARARAGAAEAAVAKAAGR